MKKILTLLSITFLTLNLVAQIASPLPLKTGWYCISSTNSGVKMKLNKSSEFDLIDSIPIITTKNIQSLKLYQANNGTYGLLMKFDSKGTELWRLATARSVGLNLAFVFDNKLLYTPKVYSEIDGGIAVLEDPIYSKDDLLLIKNVIEKEK